MVQGGRGVAPGTGPAAGVSPLTAFFGDSLTAHATWCPYYWTLGLLGAPLDVVRNGGFNGQSIGGLSTQMDSAWSASPAGLVGAPALGWIFLRIGTNNVRGAAGSSGIPISGGFEDNFRLVNNTGSLNRLTFSNVTIGTNSITDGNDGITLEAAGSAIVNVTVQDSTFTAARGDLFQYNHIGTGSGDLVIQYEVDSSPANSNYGANGLYVEFFIADELRITATQFDEQLRRLSRIIMKYKRRHPGWNLIEVNSKEGDNVIVRL